MRGRRSIFVLFNVNKFSSKEEEESISMSTCSPFVMSSFNVIFSSHTPRKKSTLVLRSSFMCNIYFSTVLFCYNIFLKTCYTLNLFAHQILHTHPSFLLTCFSFPIIFFTIIPGRCALRR